jgi:predicted nuclease of restriction endonuclease-like (RecB) superfamily
MKGFSISNLKYCREFYKFYAENSIAKQLVSQSEKSQQLVGELQDIENNEFTKAAQVVPQLENQLFQIPWEHRILIFQKIKNQPEAIFYLKQTINNNWSRAVLLHQIESNLYERQGKSVSNFQNTLPKPQSDLANHLPDDRMIDILPLINQCHQDFLTSINFPLSAIIADIFSFHVRASFQRLFSFCF